MKKEINIASIIAAIAAVLGIVATFLPWLSVSVSGIEITASGTEGDGIISLILFIAVLVLAIFGIKKDAKWIKICISIVAALAFLVAALKIPNALSNGLTVGIGIYLVIIAGLVSAIMPWIPMGKKQ